MKPAEQAASTIDVLADLLGSLFPSAESVRLVGPEERRDRDREPSLTFIVVPRAESVRLLVPNDGLAGARALQRYSWALGARETVQRTMLAAGLATGVGGLMPHRIEVVGPRRASVLELFESIVGSPVSMSLGVGSARANRKPVLGLFGRRGRPVGFAKIGDTAVAAGHVRGEAVALEQVGERRWDRLEVPRLLYSDSWNGMHVILMTPLRTRPMLPRRLLKKMPIDAMHELSAAFDEGDCGLGDTPLFSRLRLVAEAMGDTPRAASYSRALDRLGELHSDVVVRVGAWHGDFTPWNVAHRSGRLQLWDWERFETGVPFGLDRFHWVANVHTGDRGFSARALRESIGIASRLGPAPPGSEPPGSESPGSELGVSDRAVGRVYLAALAARYLLAATQPGGRVIEGKARQVLGALTADLGLTDVGEEDWWVDSAG